MMESMSIADAMALRGDNNNGFGNGWGGDFFLLILFLFLFNNNGFGNGFGGNVNGGPATAAAQNEILLGQNFDRVESKLDSIGKGICDSTYAVTGAITNEGRALQSQIAQCCCDTRVGIANLDAKLDHQTGEIMKMFKDSEITRLRDKVQDLQIQTSQCAQNEYLVNKLTPPCPVPAYMVANPYCGYNPCCGGGCGNGF